MIELGWLRMWLPCSVAGWRRLAGYIMWLAGFGMWSGWLCGLAGFVAG